MLGNFWNLQPDDLQFLGRRGEIDEEVQAASLETIRQFPRIVRGEHHEGDMLGAQGPQLRHRDLKVRQHLEQEGLELGLGLVDLVDEEYHRIVGQDGRQQRAG